MKIQVCGIGWIEEKSHGCVKKKIRVVRKGKKFPEGPRIKKILHRPFNNFGRLDAVSKTTCYAVALALNDAGIDYPVLNKEEIGIVAANEKGCLDSDIRYFKDYLDYGRTLGRSNYFVYTLPSTPISEASIYFGLQGAMFYAGGDCKLLAKAVMLASETISQGEVSIMLAGEASEDKALFMVLADESAYGKSALCSLEEADLIYNNGLGFSKTVNAFEKIFKAKSEIRE